MSERTNGNKAVFSFGNGHADGHAGMSDILGGKGANVAEMTRMGIPVPPGFTISAKMCQRYLQEGDIPASLREEVTAAMTGLEEASGRRFGDADDPLLVSVRSGGKFSMPGMMDTILNLGLTDETAKGLARQSNNPSFAYDSYRRFVEMYGRVVYGVGASADGVDQFERALHELQKTRDVSRAIDLSPADLLSLVRDYKEIVWRVTGSRFPDDPREQLWGAIGAVFTSWNNQRAVNYRRLNAIPNDLGTAVTVMAMVFGNLGEDSGSGVAFSRDPSTGEKRLFGEFLANAQGEDVVAGTRDPEPLESMGKRLPDAYAEFKRTAALLENHYRDMQDLEFTVERGKLYLLQTRTGKRTARAAVRVAVEMVAEGAIDRRTAVTRIDPNQLNQLLHPTIDSAAHVDVIARGLPASPGAAVGKVVFDAETAAERGAAGEHVILVRRETSPDDFHGMVAAQAILTARGGMTSHAAVVARGMGKCCVVGARELDVDPVRRLFSGNGVTIREGDWVTLDGSEGRVIQGRAPLTLPEPGAEFDTLMSWADEFRAMGVRANADTPEDAAQARSFGAEGIGLCRTEHMFFEGDRIHTMREMILATDLAGRRRALVQLLPMQRSDFAGIFRAMNGFPVTIRLLDPPLHEFLPRDPAEVDRLAELMDLPVTAVQRVIDGLTEANPMLGHRGCRLGILYPEITEMQVHAIIEAACEVAADGIRVIPEIMVPLVAHVEELRQQATIVRQTADRILTERKAQIPYLVGTMIELPRAALTADEIAKVADFFSFGTNDLTQTTYGLSRDDAGRFLPYYMDSGILPADPFQTIDQDGVGKLIEMGTRLGRRRNPKLKVGVCGEHGGDPASVDFFQHVGINYVSCSSFRVPIARLAAAQASLGARAPTD